MSVLYIKNGASFFSTINVYLVAVPLILTFFLILGIRTVVAHPVHLESNWIFILKENNDKRYFVKGLKKAFIFSNILPLFLVLFLFYFYLWGLKSSLYHSLFCIATGLLLINILFTNYVKVPFISSYQDTKYNHKILWPFYLVGFLFFMYFFSVLGIFLIRNPEYYILYYISIFILFFLMKWVHYYYNKELVFTYNKALEQVIVGLDFDSKEKDFI